MGILTLIAYNYVKNNRQFGNWILKVENFALSNDIIGNFFMDVLQMVENILKIRIFPFLYSDSKVM